ncbi:MAG: MFS transporter [Lentisphaerae bacterium]|jgi:fucose permease|nr:MFS transporter [Lentisphaerota bacterium]
MRRLVLTRYDYASFGCFIAYAGCSIIIPLVLYQMSVDLGFTLQEGGLAAGGALQMGRAIPMVLSMLLSGFVAGRWGMCRSLGVASLLMGGGILCAAVAPVYAVLFLALMVTGLGEGIIEGLNTPFVENLHREEAGRYLNFSHSFWAVGIIISVLLGGWLLNRGISWRFVVGGVSLLALPPTLILLLPADGKKAYPERPERLPWQLVWKQTRDILKTPRFWLFFAAMFVAGGGEFGLTFWAASYIQLEFSASAWLGGLGTACFAGGMFLGRSVSGLLVRQEYLPHLIISTAAAGVLVCLFFPLLNAPWLLEYQQQLPWVSIFTKKWLLFLLLFLAGLCSAPFWPSVQSYCVERLPFLDSTMLFILLSCAGIPGCAFVSWMMGLFGNLIGLRNSFFIVPLCYMILLLLTVVDTVQARKQVKP